MPHLVVMAAGTGGHIIPGLAVAQEMQARGWSVSWLGTTHGMENRLVPAAGIALDCIRFSGLRGKGPLHMLTGALRMIKATWDCRAILRRRGASAVLGMGGYVTVPGGQMAWMMKLPLVLVNADADMLASSHLLRSWADRVLFGFDSDIAARIPNALVTGNPVREAIESLPPPQQRWAHRQGPLRLLVVGGSLGAQVLNQTLPQALALMPPASRPLVTHQTGTEQAAAVVEAYQAAGVAADVLPFIDDMPAQLADCDMMVCRAGAITVSELCAAGVPAILVPLITSTTGHQRYNAVWMAAKGAALHLPQYELTPQKLAETLSAFTREGLLEMATKARAQARPHAAKRVADEIERLVVAP